MAAGELVGLLYDAFCKQYKNPMGEQELKDLNILCVRLVFCLYAEDAGIFGTHGMFHDYLSAFDTSHMRKAIKDLFAVLGTKPEDRDPYLEEELNAFPYCNGGLFAGDDGNIPPLTDEIRSLLLDKASAGFDWSEISPTIFGAVFESTLNPDSSLADLYDERTMPPELRRAHQANDKAVMQAYNFWGKIKSEPACVAALMQLYQSTAIQ